MKALVTYLLLTLLLSTHLHSEIVSTEVAVSAPYKVEIYTAVFCAPCKAAKKKLKDYGIE